MVNYSGWFIRSIRRLPDALPGLFGNPLVWVDD